MSVNELIAEGVRLFESNKIDEAIVKFNQAWDAIEDKNSQFGEQNNIQWWLGRCYLVQAIEIENIADVKKSFEQAIFHYLQQLQLAKKLQNKEISIQQQNDSLFWLGCCYLEQAVRTKDTTEAKKLFNQAIDAYQRQSQFVTQLQDKRIRTQEQICNIFYGLLLFRTSDNNQRYNRSGVFV